MKFLVTGGAGFIGSHLCDALLRMGHQVRVLDDLSTGSRDNLPNEVEMMVGDVAEPVIAWAAMKGVDGCFHLAAIASVARSATEWLGTHHVNLTGTIAVYDAARKHQTPVVYASSAAVYGYAAVTPITEDTPANPLSAYGADKYGCELHAYVATHVHGVPTLGLRFFNVYGPRQDPHSPYSGVISIFTQQIMNDQPIEIHGDGKQVRDFVYVDDVVQVMLTGMERLRQGVIRHRTVCNVCTGIPTSVIELAGTIAQLSGKVLDVRYQPPRAGDIRTSIGSPLWVRVSFGLEKPILLRDGLSKLLAY